MNPSIAKILTLALGSLVAFVFFGLTYSATADDGVLRATSVGLMAGLLGFGLTVFSVWMFWSIGK